MYRVDNAIIMAAGASSRFAPISYEMPKSLIKVRGEVLLERQIRQLREAGIDEIVLVVGYMKEQFYYLKDKYGVIITENDQWRRRNNNSSIYAARAYIHNSYICSSDNFFAINPFEKYVDDSYYSALYAHGETSEWCITEGDDGYINSVQIGGSNSWYMMGHVFWNEYFSKRFMEILLSEYEQERTRGLLWESIYMEHLGELKLRMRKYDSKSIYEFDTLDELRNFDSDYIMTSNSKIMSQIARELSCSEREISGLLAIKQPGVVEASGFSFNCRGKCYLYDYTKMEVMQIDK